MNKLFIIGLPRTGTTSISAALLDHFTVAHTAYTKRAFELADIISDCPCFSDYQQLDHLFPQSKFVYLDRAMPMWVPSMQMLLKKMLPSLQGSNYISPILKRSFVQTFDLHLSNPTIEAEHLISCYQHHQQQVSEYFHGRDDLLKLDVSQSNSLTKLFDFLKIPLQQKLEFPHLNSGKRVDNWKEIKHPNKINANAAGTDGRKFFTYSQST